MSDDKKRRDVIRLCIFKEFEVVCHNCGVYFMVEERELKFPTKQKYFCCVSCANSKNHNKPHSEETKKKLSNLIKDLWKDPEYAKKCLNNNKRFFSSKGEREIRQKLKDRYGTKDVSSHRIIGIDNIKKAVDLTIKNKNIIIEYDGIWHFDKKIYEKFGTPEKYDVVVKKDKMVKEYCKKNNIRLLRVGDKYYKHNRKRTFVEILEFIEKSKLNYKELY